MSFSSSSLTSNSMRDGGTPAGGPGGFFFTAVSALEIKEIEKKGILCKVVFKY